MSRELFDRIQNLEHTIATLAAQRDAAEKDAAEQGHNAVELFDALKAEQRTRYAAEKVCEAVVEIDDEGYVESMENVPSWQRLANALTDWRRTKDA